MSNINPYDPYKTNKLTDSNNFDESIGYNGGGDTIDNKNWLIIKGNGPILITSPHTIATRRRLSIHKKELYVYNIINEIYNILGPKLVTLCTWNVELLEEMAKGDGNGNGNVPQDPNYYDRMDLDSKKWFHELEALKDKREREMKGDYCSYLHIDIHGMNNTSTENDLDFGLEAMEYKDPPRSILMTNFIKHLFTTLNKEIGFGYFKGFATADVTTITQQGILLGFDSFQIELSKRLRSQLIRDRHLIRKFSKCILDLYQQLYINKVNYKLIIGNGSRVSSKIKKPLIGIVTIPIYDRLKKHIVKKNKDDSIKEATSYISKDYLDFIRYKLKSDVFIIPFDTKYETLKPILSNLDGLIIPGGSYGNTTREPENIETLLYFLSNLLAIIRMVKKINKGGQFLPIIGICLGFQLLCLSNSLDSIEINKDITNKDKGSILKRITKLDVSDGCNCKMKNRFERVYSPIYREDFHDSNEPLNYFYFTNERIIVHNSDNKKILKDILVTGVYKNKYDMEIISSIKYKHFPFLGYQFHLEKINIDAAYIRQLLNSLRQIVYRSYHSGISKDISQFKKRHKYRYKNSKNVIYYIF